MTMYLTADLHFGCENLRKHTRSEHATIEDHDAAILDAINSKVGRNDQLAILGDFCIKKPGRYRPGIRCRHIFFILGNHDKPQQIKNVFGGNVWQTKMLSLDRGHVWCSHYPHCYWPQSHYGFCHAYGHLHYNLEHEERMWQAFPERRSMDVGLESAKNSLGEARPFSETEFFELTLCFEGHGLVTPYPKTSPESPASDSSPPGRQVS